MSLQTRLSALAAAIGTDIKTLFTLVDQAEKRAILVADANSTPDDGTAVVWERTSDGAHVASVHVQEESTTPNRNYFMTHLVDAEDGGTGIANLAQKARVLAGGSRRAALLNLLATPTMRSIRVQAENNSGVVIDKLIIDSAGKSDFYQQPGGIDGGGWQTLGGGWATWYGSGWPRPQYRRIGGDLIQLQGLFLMPSDSAPQGSKSEAFDMSGLQPVTGSRMILARSQTGAMARFDVAAGQQYARWMEAGQAGGWFWMNQTYCTTGSTT